MEESYERKKKRMRKQLRCLCLHAAKTRRNRLAREKQRVDRNSVSLSVPVDFAEGISFLGFGSFFFFIHSFHSALYHLTPVFESPIPEANTRLTSTHTQSPTHQTPPPTETHNGKLSKSIRRRLRNRRCRLRTHAHHSPNGGAALRGRKLHNMQYFVSIAFSILFRASKHHKLMCTHWIHPHNRNSHPSSRNSTIRSRQIKLARKPSPMSSDALLLTQNPCGSRRRLPPLLQHPRTNKSPCLLPAKRRTIGLIEKNSLCQKTIMYFSHRSITPH